MKFDNTENYMRALEVIPTASQTFSKSAQSYVKGASPLFAKRGDGARIWDVDDNEYIDYVLGLLPVILGYRDPDVDRAITEQLERGITFSLATELKRSSPSDWLVKFRARKWFDLKRTDRMTSAAVRIAGRDRSGFNSGLRLSRVARLVHRLDCTQSWRSRSGPSAHIHIS